MSVIFKEKNFDQLLLFLKNCLMIILIVFILSFLLNYILAKKVIFFENNLKIMQAEELKYRELINNFNSTQNKVLINKEYYNLLIKLADYAENLTYKSIQLKNSKIKIEAVSNTENNILKLIDFLEADKEFLNINLLNLNKNKNYYFEIEAVFTQ
jgi:hypothetical protein